MRNSTSYQVEAPAHGSGSAVSNALLPPPQVSRAARSPGPPGARPRAPAGPAPAAPERLPARRAQPLAPSAPARAASARPPGRGRGGGGRAAEGGGRARRRRNLLRPRLRRAASSPLIRQAGAAAAAEEEEEAAGAMRRYLRIVVLCLACGFCSLLYAFSQLAASPEEGAGGGGGRPQAGVASWVAGGGRGAAKGADSAATAAHPGGSDRYGPFPVWREPGGAGGPGRGVCLARAARRPAPRLPRRARAARPFAAVSEPLRSFPSFPLNPGASPAPLQPERAPRFCVCFLTHSLHAL